MGFENVGKVWTPQGLQELLGTLTKPDWCDSITLHHTAAPSLAQRPDGFNAQHIKNIQSYYQNQLGWSSGPHLFVDDDQLWGMCDFRRKGIHAVSFNKRSIGIEVLGDYDSESAKTGRGLDCWKTAAAATKVLLAWLGLPANAKTVLFHRDDPKTSKTCPGRKVEKDWVLDLIAKADAAADDTAHAKPSLDVTLKSTEWRFVGERWCIPVRVYLLKRGVADTEIAAKLKKTATGFHFDDELLEGAFYDKDSAMTWAPARELIDLV